MIVRLSSAAETDIVEVLRWTADHFGPRQTRLYSDTILAALEQLSDGPTAAGARQREDIGRGLYTLHVARKKRKARHFIIFRIAQESKREVIEVLRVLHDTMELSLHLPPS